MASWDEILKEVQSHKEQKSSLDEIFKKYIHKFSQLRNRNTICYYSDFENKTRNENTN